MRRWPLGVFLSAVYVASVAPAVAQESSGTVLPGSVPMASAQQDTIPVGPFFFSPSVQLSWQDRDNIFFSPDNPVRDQVWQASARLLFELPVNQSRITFSYMPRYTDYRRYELQDKWSHDFEADGSFVFANGLIFNASYGYIIGNLETREVDPGGELVFGDPRFEKQQIRLGLDYWITHRDGVFLLGGWTELEHSDPRFFYDYTERWLEGGWMHQLGPSLVMDLRYGIAEFDAKDDEFGSNSFRDSLSNELTLGLDGQLSPVVATGLRAGYRRIDYDPMQGDPEISDFAGVVAEGYLAWELAHGSLVRLDVLRSPFPSNFADNANYVATGAGLLYSIDRGTLYGQVSGRFQVNDYELPDPVTGEDRADDILTMGFGLGYRINRRFSVWSTYIYEDRQSLYRYSYTANILTIGLFFGF
jgi:hypothetical protein